jgi:hypothetical protein
MHAPGHDGQRIHSSTRFHLSQASSLTLKELDVLLVGQSTCFTCFTRFHASTIALHDSGEGAAEEESSKTFVDQVMRRFIVCTPYMEGKIRVNLGMVSCLAMKERTGGGGKGATRSRAGWTR